MKVGYVRISTKEQNTARQDVLMEELGVEKIYTDKVSGKNMERPELHKMMDFVREGDVVIVESFSRFARNTRDLLDLTATLTRKSVQFISKKESIDTSTPAGKFMLTVFAALAEFERENILERQAEGIAVAKAEGRMNGRPKKAVDTFESVYTEDNIYLGGVILPPNGQYMFDTKILNIITRALAIRWHLIPMPKKM